LDIYIVFIDQMYDKIQFLTNLEKGVLGACCLNPHQISHVFLPIPMPWSSRNRDCYVSQKAVAL